MGDDIQAIETEYKGYRFRSRLEARWAVFFDSLGIVYEYEPERIEVSPRLTDLSEHAPTYGYLPDFWLPEFKAWVEVKGFWTKSQCLWFLDAAASILVGCPSDRTILVCGPLGSDGDHWPGALHMHEGTLQFYPWPWAKSTTCPIGPQSFPIATDYGGDWERVVDGAYVRDLGLDLPERLLLGWNLNEAKMMRALSAARGARFEHGESGAAKPKARAAAAPVMPPPMPPPSNPVYGYAPLPSDTTDVLEALKRYRPGSMMADEIVLSLGGSWNLRRVSIALDRLAKDGLVIPEVPQNPFGHVLFSAASERES